MNKELSVRFVALMLCIAFNFNVVADGQTTRANRETSAVERDGNRFTNFDVDVLIAGRRLEKYAARGRFYVEALEEAEYELRIHNPLPVRVAVALSVDGLNTIDARRTTAWGASKWVIEPYGTITIGGWQMSSARARRFYFTTEKDSYAARLGRVTDLGTISAVFFRERQPVSITAPSPRETEDNDAQQSSERRTRSRNTDESARIGTSSTAPRPDDTSAATGIGRSVTHDVRRIGMNLDSQPITAVTLRYEYRAALVRLGILPRTITNSDVLRRRERARGFEDGYCPEPRR
ncbi:MAG: hypothetical protein WKF74_05100 [Pyrinomonadaceae bacterium]